MGVMGGGWLAAGGSVLQSSLLRINQNGRSLRGRLVSGRTRQEWRQSHRRVTRDAARAQTIVG